MLFIRVQFLNGFSKTLWYSIPENWEQKSYIGSLVQVPLRNKQLSALVVGQEQTQPKEIKFIKPASMVESLPHDQSYMQFINTIARYYQIDSLLLIARFRHFLQKKSKKVIEVGNTTESHLNHQLTAEQQAISNTIKNYIKTPSYAPHVIHGVTGSGKTEVYKELLHYCYEQQKTALLLLPEVTLATELEQRIKQTLVHIPIYSFHSATSAKEKKQAWHYLCQGKPCIIIGVHIPVLLPIENLGLIIVDEEHEVGYQEKKHPKINSRDIALLRAQQYNIPIVLGSATPSISTLYNVKTRGWHYFQLLKRFGGNMPTIKTTSLTDKSVKRKSFWISKPLEKAIEACIAKKEQAIIFINRRGHSFFMQCQDCGFLFTCSQCSVSLTYHEEGMLTCHYCDFSLTSPNQCTQCRSPELIKKGIGTQQAVSILTKLFPHARIARADLDVTKNKKQWQQIKNDFSQGNIDILVGTQSISKGFDFPHVSVVGILWADLQLGYPFYNATETTLQQLIQVAGRCGRAKQESTVIVQTMAEHDVFNFLKEEEYAQFYDKEIENRSELEYPPTARLAEIELKHSDEKIIAQEACAFVEKLQSLQQQLMLRITILGPALPPVYKIKHMHSRKIYIKGANMTVITNLFNAINKTTYQSSIYFTPNPVR